MSDLRKVVITESVARRAFASNGADVIGRTLLINDVPQEVAGVVADVSLSDRRGLRPDMDAREPYGAHSILGKPQHGRHAHADSAPSGA